MRKILLLCSVMLASVFFVSCDSSSSDSLPVVMKSCTISNPLLQFGDVKVGESATKAIVISCLQPSKLSVTGFGKGFYIDKGQDNVTIEQANTPVTFNVHYVPEVEGNSSGYIRLTNSANSEIYETVVSGRGVKGATVAETKTVEISQNTPFYSYSFGSVNKNTSKSVMIKLKNNTGKPVKIDKLNFTVSAYGNALVAEFTKPEQLGVDQTIDVKVTYTPTVTYSSSAGGLDLNFTVEGETQSKSLSVLITGSEGTF